MSKEAGCSECRAVAYCLTGVKAGHHLNAAEKSYTAAQANAQRSQASCVYRYVLAGTPAAILSGGWRQFARGIARVCLSPKQSSHYPFELVGSRPPPLSCAEEG